MSVGFVQEVEDCHTTLKLYQDTNLYFGEFLSQLSKKDMISLVREDAEFAVNVAEVDSSIRNYLSREYGITKLTETDRAVISHLIDGNVKMTGGNYLGPALTSLLDIVDQNLNDPAFCARVLSKKSLIEVSLPLIKEETTELRQEVKDELENIKKRKEYYLHEFEYDELSEYEFKAFEKFLDECEHCWDFIDAFVGQHNVFYEEASVLERHPLYPTDYSLYVPPRKRLQIFEPIDQIILDSTKNPRLIYGLSPREFEKFLMKIFEGFGYHVDLTAQTRDGGTDLICLTTKHNIPVKIAVEAKRYHPSRPISVELVRQFVGANAQIRANKLVYVTTSRYTKDAIKYASSPILTHLLELKELPDIIEWTNQFQELKYPYIL